MTFTNDSLDFFLNNAKKNAYSQTRASHLGPYIKLKSVRPAMGAQPFLFDLALYKPNQTKTNYENP
jgi:hypothetical protein